MTTSRRAFLKTAAVAPIAASIAGAAPSAAAPVVETAVSQALPPAVQYPFKWYLSTDGGEVFHDECGTKEEILKIAKEYGGGMIAECQQQDFDLVLDGRNILDLLESRNEEVIGEGDFLWCNQKHRNELGDMVTAAIQAWVRKNNISTTAWTFREVRNQTVIEEEKLLIQAPAERR